MARDSYCEGVHEGIAQLLAAGGGIVQTQRGLGPALTRAVSAKELCRLLPATYCSSSLAHDLATKARALMARDPHAVLVGRAAAALTWWPGLTVPILEAWRASDPPDAPGFRWTSRNVPYEHILEVDGIRLITPAASVLDLIPSLAGSVIDEALRRRAVSLDGLWAALAQTPRRRGNPMRARLLRDSRDEPWSEAERWLHRIVRGLSLPWLYRTNHRVRTATVDAYIDLALPALSLGFEVDGYDFHGSRAAFTHDRVRDLELSAVGWEMHRLAATTVTDEPGQVGVAIASIARQRACLLGLPREADRSNGWRAA